MLFSLYITFQKIPLQMEALLAPPFFLSFSVFQERNDKSRLEWDGGDAEIVTDVNSAIT